MSKIYTKKGDQLETSLFDGRRVRKSDDSIELLGLMDSMMAHLCLIIAKVKDPYVQEVTTTILSHLRPLMGELAGGPSFITKGHVSLLESYIDFMDNQLVPLNHFISFEQDEHAAYLNLWRTSIRTVERQLSRVEGNFPLISMYLNRLSDVAFTLSRYILEVTR